MPSWHSTKGANHIKGKNTCKRVNQKIAGTNNMQVKLSNAKFNCKKIYENLLRSK